MQNHNGNVDLGDMGASEISPIQFGQLLAEVAALKIQVSDIQRDVRSLMAMSDAGRGAMWVMLGFASVVGSIIGWAASHFNWGTRL